MKRPTPDGPLSTVTTASGYPQHEVRRPFRQVRSRREDDFSESFKGAPFRTCDPQIRSLSVYPETSRRRPLCPKRLSAACRKRKMATPNTGRTRNQEKSAFFTDKPLIFRGSKITGPGVRAIAGQRCFLLTDILFSLDSSRAFLLQGAAFREPGG